MHFWAVPRKRSVVNVYWCELVFLVWCGELVPEFCPIILGTPCIFSEISTFTQCMWSWCYQIRRPSYCIRYTLYIFGNFSIYAVHVKLMLPASAAVLLY